MGPVLSSIRRLYLDLSTVISELNHTKRSFDALLTRLSTVTPPVPNPSKSYWQEDPPFPNLVDAQSPDLPTTADIVIIGSGISGASVAYTILTQSSKRGASPKVVLVEARKLCSGATGRNGGHIKCSPYLEYAGLKARFGREHAKKLLQFQRRHLAVLLELAQQNEDLKISEVREVETVDTFTDETTWNEAKKMVHELRQDAPDMAEDVVIHDGTEACDEYQIDPQYCYGIITYKAGALSAYRLVTALYASLLSTYNATFSVETNTPATDIHVNADNPDRPFTVLTPRGEISAAHVIHATDAFAANLVPGLTDKIFPVRGHMTAQEPGTLFPKLGGARSWSFIHRRGFDYISQRPTGELMAGGGVVQSPEKGLDEFGIWRDDRSSYAIRAYLEGLLPAVFGAASWGDDRGARVKLAWTGCMGFTPDLLPYVGVLDQRITQRKTPSTQSKDGKPLAEWISAGFQGGGMVLAWLSGVAVGLMLVGEEDEVFGPAPGIPGGRIAEWLPEELICSKQRVDRLNASNLATLL
ncbi:FAD dependent oxidoreductase-domain-containing protein [Aspergillus ambiguus]|uniref:NAD(P)/FAD-dependent oxidoreductase n=1 Tax=Aspergillus ambiguus TaxID=176160 RepID=UPI003CCDC9D8